MKWEETEKKSPVNKGWLVFELEDLFGNAATKKTALVGTLQKSIF